MTTQRTHVIDMNSPEGMVEHLSTLPTRNLLAIVARKSSPLTQAFVLEAVAEGVLIVRGIDPDTGKELS
jgi:hypothetical protein